MKPTNPERKPFPKMRVHDLRRKYIEFFESKGHLYQPASPLVPIDALGVEDKSTLFTSAGMQQYKPYFTGAAVPPSTRICTVQKCLRTGDIDSVGDYSHCTLFEMLGNFSFGDYFKKEVIHWTWEFLTGVLGLDEERFCVTVFADDDEAFSIWHDEVGLPADRIHRLGEDKNYWPANAISQGPNGPCGPCSEVFFRVAPLEEMTTDPALSPTERYLVDDDAGRWLEVWNNVFTQFDRGEDERGKAVLTPLPKKNNDTGAGLDRIAYVVQGKTSVFETDLFQPTLERIAEISGLQYGGSMSAQDFAFRVVAEHTRASVFCIADGILPSNEGRGYVLRYVMRRAIRYGKKDLGFAEPFMHEVAPAIIDQMGEFYTELRERRELILKTILREEESFRRTLDNGMARLEEMLAIDKVLASKTLSGDEVFMLYDTYGFPLNLTEEIAAERGFAIDMEGFERAMERQRDKSKEGSKIAADVFAGTDTALADLQRTLPPTQFLAYGHTVAEANILGLIVDGESVETARAGDEVTIVLNRTPFYAESGGQVGDTGQMVSAAGDVTCALKIDMTDAQRSGGLILHTGRVLEGEASVGQHVAASVDAERRRHIMRNHTATHLLQAALREVVGAHVHQKGSRVDPERLRFDFTHVQPVTPEELRRVEEIVNAEILNDEQVVVHTDLPIAEAKARGAMALFGEKYGDKVRMIEIADFSRELCGGTHLSHTSQIGLFKIVSETGVALGVRRIEAVTGQGAYRLVSQRDETLRTVAALLKSSPADVLTAAERLVQQRQELERQNRALKSGAGAAPSTELEAEQIEGVPVVRHRVDGADAEAVGNLADRTAKRLGSA
ncbi:MAG TPA: alanine--tRNA ligase, partial [Chthonomonadaceae bacterium]|nr:alanine--tRNA ligase [Chthonomonadaceae bacterium]